MPAARRVLLDEDPFHPAPAPFGQVPWDREPPWPCSWISLPATRAPAVVAYRRRFELPAARTVRLHVTADERYELFLDGERIGRGPERGDGSLWFFETHDVDLAAGDHVLVALVWSLGERAPMAQMSVRHGLLVAPEAEEDRNLLGTGVAPWTALASAGRTFRPGCRPGFVGGEEVCDAALWPRGVERGEGEGWRDVAVVEQALPAHHAHAEEDRHALRPAMLPAMLDEPVTGLRVRAVDAVAPPAAGEDFAGQAPFAEGGDTEPWQALVDRAAPVAVPAHTSRRVLVDLDEYRCVHPVLAVAGGAGARVVVSLAEACGTRHETWPFFRKGHRDDIDGRSWRGLQDELRPDGGPFTWRTLWWRAGRYLLLQVQTAAQALEIRGLALRETRYPLEMMSRLELPLPSFRRIVPIALRGLQMCAHETYMDCPHYEQLMYVGDTRLEALTTYCLTPDPRLPRKGLVCFDASRLRSGLTQSRHPSRERQVIPPFSLWWVCCVHDHALWRDDPALIRSLLPGVRAVIDAFAALVDDDGLVRHPPGWNFVDWVHDAAWNAGVPADGGHGITAPVQWQWVLALQAAAELHAACDEPEIAARCLRLREPALAGCERFFDADRGLYANDLDRSHVSEHANCLALASGALAPDAAGRLADALFAARLPRASIYYSHYLFEAARAARRPDVLHARLAEWYELADLGFKTTREAPEPSRSDCHGWGAHPLFHAFATILGIRPDAPGFARVRIEPLLGDLPSASGELPHPRGTIRVDLHREGGRITGQVVLPGGVTGVFVDGEGQVALEAGTTAL